MADKGNSLLLSLALVVLVGVLVGWWNSSSPTKPKEEKGHTVKGRTANDWLARLKSKDRAEREEAAGVLRQDLGRDDQAFVPDLLKALKDDSSFVRGTVVAALGRLGLVGDARDITPALAGALADKDLLVRSGAAEALKRLGPKARPAIPALIVALKDRDARVGGIAAETLGAFGASAIGAVPSLIEIVKDRRSGVRAPAATALGNIGQEAEVVVPVLIAVLVQPGNDVGTQLAVREALAPFGPSAVRALVAIVSDPREGTRSEGLDARCEAASTLGMMGPKAKEAVPALLRAMRDRNGSLRASAAEALEEIDPEAAKQARRE
jgi:HEAT repeat protein